MFILGCKRPQLVMLSAKRGQMFFHAGRPLLPVDAGKESAKL
jgi:hypothetical protein